MDLSKEELKKHIVNEAEAKNELKKIIDDSLKEVGLHVIVIRPTTYMGGLGSGYHVTIGPVVSD